MEAPFGSNSKRQTYQINAYPGPTTYDPQKINFQKSPSFGVKTNKFSTVASVNLESPGPCKYDLPFKPQNTGTIFSKSTRSKHEKDEKVPGPGSYYNETNQLHKNSGFSFGTAPKMRSLTNAQRKDSSFPCPGQYEMPSYIGTGIAKSITSKHPELSELHSQDVPGPGAYDPQLTHKQSLRIFSIGKGQRPDLMKVTNTPGPGHYTAEVINTSHKFGIGTGSRPPIMNLNGNPGPSEYQIQNTLGQSFSAIITGRREDIKGLMLNTPGPGAYDITLVNKNQSASFVFGTGARQPEKKSEFEKPSPNTYEVKEQIRIPTFKFTNSPRFKVKKQKILEPGPGMYDLPSSFADVPKYLLPRPKIKASEKMK